MTRKAIPFLIYVLGCCAGQLPAQQPGFPSGRPPVAASSTTRPVPQVQTPLLITFALTPEQSAPAADTLPDAAFRFYDPARRKEIDWGTLGNLGSAARPLLLTLKPQIGFNTGIDAFDLYMVRPAQLGFYRNTQTFSDATFSQGRNQFETNLNAKYSRTFAGGMNFSLDYRTLNNLGQYRYQRDKHNALVMGCWIPVRKRYDLFLIYARNVIRQQENGGILTDTVFGKDDLSGPIAAAVRMPREVAFSRLDEQSFQATQHLRLLGTRRVLRMSHNLNWTTQKFKFADQGANATGIGDDAAFLDPLFVTDVRGLRHFMQLDRVENALTLNTFNNSRSGRTTDLLAAGLTHAYYRVDQDPISFKQHNLFLTGKLLLSPSTRFNFNAEGALGLIDENLGEYQLQGGLSLQLGKAGNFSATLLSQRRQPGLIYRRMYVSERKIWDNDWQKPIENSLSARYALPAIGLELGATAHVVNNYLYFNQKGAPEQTTSPLQVTQLLVKENLKWGSLRFDNTFALQQQNRSDILRLPGWFSKNSLYFSGNVFRKKMLLHAGVDFRMNAEFTPDAYHPMHWQFYLQDSLRAKAYPWVDLFISFKVQSFRGFARFENFTSVWDNSKVMYQTAWHPQPFAALRFGIAWRFMDNNVSAPDENQQGGSGGSGTITPSERRPNIN